MPDDAEQIIVYVHRLDAEPESLLPRAPGEFRVTIEQERAILVDYTTAENSVYLVAEIDGEIVGTLSCQGGTRQSTRHNASFGMAVDRERRNQGVGTTLLAHLVEWAEETGILRRLELEVFAHNENAIRLYRKFGFVEEGRRKRAYFQHGRWIDGLLMARQL